MKNFTVEEINLMCCFNTSSRKRLIDDMKSVTLNDVDSEIAELMQAMSASQARDGTDSSTAILMIFPMNTGSPAQGKPPSVTALSPFSSSSRERSLM